MAQVSRPPKDGTPALCLATCVVSGAQTQGVFSGGAARCTLLQKDGQRDGFCVSNRRNTKSLDNPSGQTAPRVHVSTTFPTVSGPASRHWPGRSSVNLVIGEDDPMPTDHFSLDYGIGERMAL